MLNSLFTAAALGLHNPFAYDHEVRVTSPAFRKALAPLPKKTYPGKVGSTSRGRNSLPRRGTRLVDNPEFGRFYTIDLNGTIRRVL